MKLELSCDEAALRTGAANGSLFSKWERGKALPSPPAMLRIYAATAGTVTPNDFYALPELAEAAAA